MRLFKYISNLKLRRKQIKKIYQRYPLTKDPVVPDILKQAVEFKTFPQSNCGNKVLGFTFAEKGKNLVNPQCLEMIRKKFLKIFEQNPLVKEFEKPHSGNLIAISYASQNFEIGKSCQDFKLIPYYTENPCAFYTHQKLSENLQYTYYNENGTEFQAGFCYYPAPIGQPKLLRANQYLMNYAEFRATSYPLRDRKKNGKKAPGAYECYGRFCKSTGRQEVVLFKHNYPYHLGLNLLDDWLEDLRKCADCYTDYYTYKWKDPNPAAPAPIYRSPLFSTRTEPLTVLKILQSAEMDADVIEKLKSIPADTGIPMVHKRTWKALPEAKWPKTKDLILAILINKDWAVDCSELENMSSQDPEDGLIFLDPTTYRFSMWLLINTDYKVESKPALMAQLMLENSRWFEKCEKTFSLKSDLSTIRLEDIECIEDDELVADV